MNKKRKILLIISSITLITITILMVLSKTIIIDNFIYNIVKKTYSPFMTSFMMIVSDYGIILGIIVTSIFIMYLFPKKYVFRHIVNIIAILILNTIIKSIFKRDRPLYSLIDEIGYSYPSAHAMLSFVIYGYFIYLTKNYMKNSKYKKIIYIICTLMIILIGLSRIYLGVHYPSDVIVGYLSSIIFLIFVTNIRSINKEIKGEKTYENNSKI